MIIGCAGGGSNFAGLTFPWLGRTFRGGRTYRVIAAEPEAAPSLTRGVYAYDFGDTAKMTPLVKMHTLGSRLHPGADPRRRPALSRHGAAGVALLKELGAIEARASTSWPASRRASSSPATEGILPAPEPTHALKVAIDEAIDARESGRGAGDPVQPVRPRPLRPVGVREVPGRHARGLRVPGRGGQEALEALPRM